jgi:hypothetical protein
MFAVMRPQNLLYAAVLASMGVFVGCSGTDSQVTRPSIVGMTNTTPPYYSDGQITLYQVQVPVTLPMRMPDAQETAALGPAPAYLAGFGAATAPWIRVDDVQTTVRFTITNLDDQKHAVELLLDAWNPYVKYVPQIQIVSDDVTLPDLSSYDRYYVLEPKTRYVGTLNADDTREMAIDLATVMNMQINDTADPNLNAMFNHTFNLQNRSTGNDPLIAPWIPPPQDIPALIGFDLGLRSMEQMNVAVEVTVDVQDVSDGKKVMPVGLVPDADNQPMPPPAGVLSPPKAPAMM